MTRFIYAFCAVFLMTIPVQAARPYNPPISGDMAKMVVYPEPSKISNLVLSSSGSGLTYVSEFSGKIVILNVWATWCPPCVEELPSLNALQYALGGAYLQVVPVSIDTAATPDTVKKYMDDNKLDKLTPYIDINQAIPKMSELKGVPGIPVTLILDPHMRLLARVEGNVDWNGPAARAVIDYYMKNVSYSIVE